MFRTDLLSFEVRRGEYSSPTHLVLAAYWDRCPLPYGRDGGDCLFLGSQPLETYILSVPSVRPWEPGVHYRLPLAACEALRVDVPISLIPFRIDIEHTPFTGFHVDEHGRGTPPTAKPTSASIARGSGTAATRCAASSPPRWPRGGLPSQPTRGGRRP